MEWPAAILGVMALASAGTWLVYWSDKRRARAGRRRVRERTLHLWELAGGWPGGLVARRALRHKTRDRRFLVVSWAIIALHAAVWSVAAWRLLRPGE